MGAEGSGESQVRDIGGMAAPMPSPARVSNAPFIERDKGFDVGSALAQKMLSMLLKAPALWASLDESLQAPQCWRRVTRWDYWGGW